MTVAPLGAPAVPAAAAAATTTTTTATSPHQLLNGFVRCAFLISSRPRTFSSSPPFFFAPSMANRSAQVHDVSRAVCYAWRKPPTRAGGRTGGRPEGRPAGRPAGRAGEQAGGRASGRASHPFMHPSMHPSIHLSIHPSLRPSIGYAGLTTVDVVFIAGTSRRRRRRQW